MQSFLLVLLGEEFTFPPHPHSLPSETVSQLDGRIESLEQTIGLRKL